MFLPRRGYPKTVIQRLHNDRGVALTGQKRLHLEPLLQSGRPYGSI